MQLNKSSKFIQLTDYALLEYEYNSSVINTQDADFIRVLNAFTGSISYMNYNPRNFSLPRQLTGNVLDYSVQQINDTTWLHFDTDRPFKFYEQNDNLLFQPIYMGRKTELNVVYDSIKVHLVSGWNFEDLSGLIIRAAYVDGNTLDQVFAANYAYLKEDTHINLNPHPILLGDRTYNRYIEVKIPSLKAIIDTEYQISDIFSSDVVYDNIKYNNLFYSKLPSYGTNCKINLLFYEVQNYSTGQNGQIEIRTPLPLGNETSGIIRRELMAYDDFSNLSAVVQESLSGDYFEFFPTYNGEFLEDFLMEQNSRGKDYVAIHDITLYEQVTNFGNYTEIITHKQTFFQEDGFDQVFKYRPVIENDNTITFTIEYTFRLLDKVENSQIIRKTTYTYPNAKKYARWLNKLNIPVGFQPIRVVNKIIKKDDKVFSSNMYNTTRNNGITTQTDLIKSIVPIQYKDISINSYTLFVDSTDVSAPKILYDINTKEPLRTDTFNFKSFLNSKIIYGQGDAIIYLNKFDNFIKFKLYKYSGISGEGPQTYSDLKSSDSINFYLVFYDKTGVEQKIKELNKVDNLNMDYTEEGTLIFKIPSNVSKNILESNNKNFYITVENKISTKVTGTNAWNYTKDFETVLYSGTFMAIENYNTSTDIEYQTKEQLLNSRLSDADTIRVKLEKLQQDYSELFNKIESAQFTAQQQDLMDNFKAKWETHMADAQTLLSDILKNASTL